MSIASLTHMPMCDRTQKTLTPQFIVVTTASGLSTAVSRLTHIAFVVYTLTAKYLL